MESSRTNSSLHQNKAHRNRDPYPKVLDMFVIEAGFRSGPYASVCNEEVVHWKSSVYHTVGAKCHHRDPKFVMVAVHVSEPKKKIIMKLNLNVKED